MANSRSDSVVSSSAGDSASGGRNGGMRAMMARSRVPARRARVSAGVVASRRVTFSCGGRVARALGTSPAAAVGNAPSRIGPVAVSPPSSSRRTVSSSSRIRVALASRRAPAGVSVTPRRPRSNSRCSAAASSAAIWRETADCVYPSESAASENDPVCATSRRTRRPVGEGSSAMRFPHGNCAAFSFTAWNSKD